MHKIINFIVDMIEINDDEIEYSKNKYRALRRYLKRNIQKRNVMRMNKEPYMGRNKPYDSYLA